MQLQNLLLAMLAIVILGVLGCAKAQIPPADADMNAESTDDPSAVLARLDPVDRDVAVKQAVCPVSDHALGSMGAPVKMTHDGATVFLCCDSCKEAFERDPAAFVAKVKK
jgi:YHS domain-containing protein